MFKKIALAAVLATLTASSFAAAPGAYVGGEVGSTKFDGVSGNKASYGVVAGYNFNQNFAVEAGYGRLGKVDIMGYDVKFNQAQVSVIGSVPLNSEFNVYARLGYNNLEASVNGSSASDNGALYGVGVGYNFNKNVSGRLEVQRPAADVTNVRVGVVYSF
jgi:OOP family OmpA-OmpF porin